MDDVHARAIVAALERLARAAERALPPAPGPQDLLIADGFVWEAKTAGLRPVPRIAALDLELLRGIERQRDLLLENTRRFADGLPANNALLWGARGMGKSSLVKSVHAAVNRQRLGALALVEIHRDDLPSLPTLLEILARAPRRCLVFCDDLSFASDEPAYKSLKAVLEGGLSGRPPNVLFYATSNRRHLMPRDMAENERQTGLHPGEGTEEMVSLSDRFGLWLGFHACDQDHFLEMVDRYADWLGLEVERRALHQGALEWAMTRGHRSGRTAWQFIQDLAGRAGRRLPE